MKYNIIFDNFNTNNIEIKGGFDNPKKDESGDKESLFVSGWFYNSDFNISILVDRIFLDGSIKKDEYFLDFYRKDVVEYLDLNLKNENLGFQFIVDLLDVDRVDSYLKVDDTLYKVWSCEKQNVPTLEVKSLPEKIWQDLHNFRDINKDFFCDDKFFESINLRLKTYRPVDFCCLFKEKYLIEDLDFTKFLKNFQSASWSIDVISNLNNNDFLIIESFIPGEVFYCRWSLVFDDVLFLFFQNEKDSFYLIQHSTNVALFFPNYFGFVNLFIDQWVDLAKSKVHRLFEFLLNNQDVIHKFRENAKFSGLLLSHSRPYHFFYDCMRGLDYLSKNNKNNFDVYSIKGFDFFDVECSYDRFGFNTILNEELNSYLLNNNSYLIMPCLPYFKSKSEEGGFYDLLVCDKFKEKIDLDLSSYDCILWVGVSVEKRQWIEQIEGYANIIENLKEKYKNIFVMVDGRTFPLNPIDSDFYQKNLEDGLFFDLSKKVSDVRFLNLIGMTSMEKIYFAEKIDFFISNYTTDSMYPSAFCKKPGVVYISPYVTDDQKSLHAHFNIIEVPKDRIRTIGSADKEIDWHKLSISMDWIDVYDCVLDLIEKYKN